VFTSLVAIAATQGKFKFLTVQPFFLTVHLDIAVDGNDVLKDSTDCSSLAEPFIKRLGLDSAVARKPVLRVYVPNYWTQHWLFCVFHGVSRI
jgi:hypothetical protein